MRFYTLLEVFLRISFKCNLFMLLAFYFFSVVSSIVYGGRGSNKIPTKLITASEIAEIKKFSDLSQEKGNLLTPPRGAIDPKIIAVRYFIRNLVEEIAGKELKEQGINYVINIYGQSNINAWVQQMNPENKSSLEGKWIKENPNKIWPLREIWGFTDDNKPIYEIAVTTALMTKLEYIARSFPLAP